MDINLLLKKAAERSASDLHLKVGSHPILRVDGHLVPLEDQPKITQEEAVSTAFSIMNNNQKQRFKEKAEVDLAYSASGLGRFRVNVFQQRGTISIVVRVVPTKILSIEELNLPKVLEKLSMEQRGLVLVTGTTGSGKTTTLASMIDFMNKNRADNIITIEDPIEYLHRDRRSIISQREVGNDTESFGIALRSALRQDPDIILVGEMRDFETISTAMVAAETGHLVLSTLHTIDAAETINRVISVFPPYQQKQVRLQLASVIKGIVSMRLVPRADGKGRVPAIEVMVATQTIRECIIDPDKSRKIRDVIAAGLSQYGMQTFDQSLYDLYHKGLVTFDEALKWCSNPDDFALKVKGIQSTRDLTWEVTGKETSEKRSEKSPEKGEEKIKIDRFGQ